jgi:replicative DNA helicase
MAKELGIHLILVSQIRKEVSQRRFSRPTMNDLKNAGALTEIADIILGVHRPYYNSELALKASVADNIRGGYTNTAEGLFGDGDGDSIIEAPPNDDLMQEDLNRNSAEILIMKQRMGENNALINFHFNPKTTGFSQIAESLQADLNKNKKDLMDE